MNTPLGIAVFGNHGIVIEVAQHLKDRAQRVLIVDRDEDNLKKARERDFYTAQIDPTDDTELWAILSNRAIGTVLTLFDNDAENVFLVISARALKPELRIVTIAESADSVAKLIAAGANKIINPHELGGRKIWSFIDRPLIAEILDHTLFSQADLNMAELEVTDRSPIRGRRFGEVLGSNRFNIVLLGLVRAGGREDFVFSMRALNHVLIPGDLLVVIGPREDLGKAREALVGE
jgi:voltage-gated potassium channel